MESLDKRKKFLKVFPLILFILLIGCQKQVTRNTRKDVEKGEIAKILKSDKEGEVSEVIGFSPTKERQISLVFEGFDTESNMRKIIDLLKENKIPAVFFVSGVEASENTETMKYMTSSGFDIGNYWLRGEKNIEDYSYDEKAENLYITQKAIFNSSGQYPKYMKLNSGTYTNEILRISKLCEINKAVEPNLFLNYKSFGSYEEAFIYTDKILSGSIISIKIEEELDENEYQAPKVVITTPAIDPQATIDDLDEKEEIPKSVYEVTEFLVNACKDKEIKFVKLDELKKNSIFDESQRPLSNESIKLLNISNYEKPVTKEPLGQKESKRVTEEFFDDAVFIGDSITRELENYIYDKRRKNEDNALGEAIFLTDNYLSVSEANKEVSDESKHPIFNNIKLSLEDNLQNLEAKKAYILLGMNEIDRLNINNYLDNYKILLVSIKEKVPDIDIYIQSLTPVTSDNEKFSNEEIFEYNLQLCEFCLKYGFSFVDISYVMKDENGDLPLLHSTGNQGIHFDDEYLERWVDYLYTHS